MEPPRGHRRWPPPRSRSTSIRLKPPSAGFLRRTVSCRMTCKATRAARTSIWNDYDLPEALASSSTARARTFLRNIRSCLRIEEPLESNILAALRA